MSDCFILLSAGKSKRFKSKINKDKDGFKFTQFNYWWDKVISKKS